MNSSNQTSPAPAGLRRVLTRGDLILYGLVLLGPTAPYSVYGIIQQTSHGQITLSYLGAMVAMLFTAASYGKLSTAFPTAGSTYTYARRCLNEHVGFLAGWSMILDYCLIPLLSMIYCALTAERLLPVIPYWIWAIFFTAAITLINIRGIRVTAKASTVMMAVMSVCATLFIVTAIRWVIAHHGLAGLLPDFSHGFSFSLGPLVAGAGIATISYIGFDAISTLAEDTVRPEKDIGFATVLTCVLQTVICVVTVYVAGLVWPDYNSFPNQDTAILDIGQRMGGNWMFGTITLVLLVAGFGSALTGQAGASRLLFGMGRDGVISSRIFAHVDKRHSTPTRSIYLMGGVSLVCALTLRYQSAVELVNFGAFVGFILVNLSVIRHFYIRKRQRSGIHFFTNLVFPTLGAIICTYVWLGLTPLSRIAGFLWLGLGVIYLAILTRGFRVAPKAIEFQTEE